MRKLEDLKDVRFVMTDEMRETAIKLIVIKQMLDEKDLTKKDERVLKKEFDKLFKDFRDEFQAHNQVMLHFVRAYLSGK